MVLCTQLKIKILNSNGFINLNNSFDSGLNNLFFGTNLVYFKNKIFVSSNDSFYILDSKTGANLHKKIFHHFLDLF